MSQHVLFHCVNPHVICYIKSRSLQSTKLRRLRTREGLQGGQTIQQRSEVFASRWSLMLLPVLYIHACALSAHIVCVCQRVYKGFTKWLCLSLLVLLIFGWLPHHCPFLKLGTFTQTFSVSLWYMLLCLGGDITGYRVS
jgi:hypothetical protein